MSEHAAKQSFPSNGVYDALKFIAMIGLPVLGAAYFGFASIWGLPHAQDVVGSIVIIDTALGALLGLSASQYKKSDAPYDGEVEILNDVEDKTVYSLNLNPDVDVDDISSKKQLVFKINPIDVS